ncbi:MAG: PAS domain S-box protein [Bacteroidetes bacterium]|nr:PAS domain S-box protein [Bacteroidota bacterium]
MKFNFTSIFAFAKKIINPQRGCIGNALRESEEMCKLLFECSPVGLSITDFTGKILSINKRALKIFGYKKEEILSITSKNFYVNPNDREVIIQKINNGEKIHNLKIKMKRKEGKLIDVEINISPIKFNNEKHLLSVFDDITNRKIAEKKILQLSRGLEQSPAMVTITDTDGIIEYSNPKVTEITGYTAEELLGKNVNILQSGQTSKETYEELWDTILQGKVWKGEILNKKKNGELYWDSEIIAPIIDNEGNIINFITIREDITEKKKMTEELIKAKDKAEEMNRLKSNFLANMSHELRTPLIGIMGFSEILKDSIKESELKEYASMVYEGGNRLLETLNLILNFSKIESEKIKIDPSQIDVVAFIKRIVNLFDKEASMKNLYLNFESKLEKLILEIDEKMLKDILINLLNNAIKFTKKGGVTIKVSKTKENKFFEICVIDTGIGIPKKRQHLIWLEFRQVSEGSSRLFEGSGLGLTITKKFINMLGGEINLESEVDVGSTFIVSLPIQEKTVNQTSEIVTDSTNTY